MISIGSLLIDSLDYIMIVDKDYNIIYNTRYEPEIGDDGVVSARKDHIFKNFFEVYPDLKREESNIVKCLETGQVIIRKNQKYRDYLGTSFTTDNVTIPIRRNGKVVAAVELTLDGNFMKENSDSAEPIVSSGTRGSDFSAQSGREMGIEKIMDNIKEAAGEITFDSILTEDRELRDNIEKAKMLAALPTPTLIYGETGTGKELFAQAMIRQSGVPAGKVVIQNCAAVPDTLIESILFGTVKGAYTDAENRKGLFETANGGIIFLDELNSMPATVQAKLLRVLQDGTFRPLGSSADKKVKVKVIAAMNVDPVRAMENGILRKDLFYRFSGGLITIPPLRARKDDIRLFTEHYVESFAETYGKQIDGISDALMQAFMEYPWEGNVRELMNAVEFMVSCAGDSKVLDETMLPAYMKQSVCDILRENGWSSELAGDDAQPQPVDYHEIMMSFEKKLVVDALEKTGWNKSRAARLLGIPRQTLKYRMKILEIR